MQVYKRTINYMESPTAIKTPEKTVLCELIWKE